MEMGRKPGTGNRKQGAWTHRCHGNCTMDAVPAGSPSPLTQDIHCVTLGVTLNSSELLFPL